MTGKSAIGVRDNGPGFDTLGSAAGADWPGPEGHRERLLTMYGSEQSVNIHSVPARV